MERAWRERMRGRGREKVEESFDEKAERDGEPKFDGQWKYCYRSK